MSRFPLRIIVLAASALLAIGSGCEGGSKPAVDTSMEEATVKGLVTFKGKAVTKGEIAFDRASFLRVFLELPPGGGFPDPVNSPLNAPVLSQS